MKDKYTMSPEDFVKTLFPLMPEFKTPPDVKITRIVLLESVRMDGAGWFRLFGVGLKWKDTIKHQLLFSERNGYAKHLMIGKWSVKFLKWRR